MFWAGISWLSRSKPRRQCVLHKPQVDSPVQNLNPRRAHAIDRNLHQLETTTSTTQSVSQKAQFNMYNPNTCIRKNVKNERKKAQHALSCATHVQPRALQVANWPGEATNQGPGLWNRRPTRKQSLHWTRFLHLVNKSQCVDRLLKKVKLLTTFGFFGSPETPFSSLALGTFCCCYFFYIPFTLSWCLNRQMQALISIKNMYPLSKHWVAFANAGMPVINNPYELYHASTWG